MASEPGYRPFELQRWSTLRRLGCAAGIAAVAAVVASALLFLWNGTRDEPVSFQGLEWEVEERQTLRVRPPIGDARYDRLACPRPVSATFDAGTGSVSLEYVDKSGDCDDVIIVPELRLPYAFGTEELIAVSPVMFECEASSCTPDT